MAKLAELVSCLAAALNIRRASMNVLAAELRKVGLIRRAGRGPYGADMGASDATNLILAALGGGYATQSAERVKILREGGIHQYVCGDDEGVAPPFHPFDKLGRVHTLGEALDAVIDEFVQCRGLSEDELVAMPVTNLEFWLERDCYSYTAGFWFWHGVGDDDTEWRVSYIRQRPEFDRFDFEGSEKPDKRDYSPLAKVMTDLNRMYGRRVTRETVDFDLFSRVAECIGRLD